MFRMSIEELEQFFSDAQLPAQLKLDQATRIIDVPRFLDGHFSVLRQNAGNSAFAGFQLRLEQAREIIIKQQT